RPARAEPGVGAAGGEPHRGQAGRAAGRAGGRRRLAGRPLPQPAVEPPLGDGQVAGGWPVATKPRPRPFVLDPSQGALMPPVFTAARPADAETVTVLAVPVLAGRTVPAGVTAELDIGFLQARGFEAKLGETLALLADDGGTVLAVGMGEQAKLDGEAVRKAGAAGGPGGGVRAGPVGEGADRERGRLAPLGGVPGAPPAPPRLIRLVYQPAGAAAAGAAKVPTVALVGKGITFDSGGLSLKTS